jgi:integrase
MTACAWSLSNPQSPRNGHGARQLCPGSVGQALHSALLMGENISFPAFATRVAASRSPWDAVRWGRLIRNSADAADPPRVASSGSPNMVTWTPEALGVFLVGVHNDRMMAAYLPIATIGMRRGEALGLRWADVDLEAGRAAIRQTLITVNHVPTLGTPKTARGERAPSGQPRRSHGDSTS